MKKQIYSYGTCQCCGEGSEKPMIRLLWGLCRRCSKTFEDEFGKEWSWDPVDDLMKLLKKF
jgi:hypothetical protein